MLHHQRRCRLGHLGCDCFQLPRCILVRVLWLNKVVVLRGLIHSCLVTSGPQPSTVLFADMVADVLCDVCANSGKQFVDAAGKVGCVSCICRTRYYCSRECHRSDWEEHKTECTRYPEYLELVKEKWKKKKLEMPTWPREARRQVRYEAAKQVKRGLPDPTVITSGLT